MPARVHDLGVLFQLLLGCSLALLCPQLLHISNLSLFLDTLHMFLLDPANDHITTSS